VPIAVPELGATVQARIVEGLDRVVLLADDEDRVAGDVVDGGVAGVRYVLLEAGHLPHPAPHALDLEVVERPGSVPLDRDVVRTQVLVRLGPEGLRHRHRLPVQELLNTRPGTSAWIASSFDGFMTIDFNLLW